MLHKRECDAVISGCWILIPRRDEDDWKATESSFVQRSAILKSNNFYDSSCIVIFINSTVYSPHLFKLFLEKHGMQLFGNFPILQVWILVISSFQNWRCRWKHLGVALKMRYGERMDEYGESHCGVEHHSNKFFQKNFWR